MQYDLMRNVNEMPKFTLSAPQKLLVGLSIFLFAVTLLLIVYIVFTEWNVDFRRDVYISYSTNYPVINEQEEKRGFSYDQQIKLTEGETLIRWGNHSTVLYAPSTFIVTADSIKISEGYAFIKTEDPLKIFLSNQQLQISNASGVYESGLSNFLVTSGEIQVNPAEKAIVNQIILYDGIQFTTASFDRAELTQAIWTRIISGLKQVQMLPEILADIEAPSINNIDPEDNFLTDEQSIQITGTTDSDARLEINGTQVDVNSDGQFSFSLNLNAGQNIINLKAIDPSGNEGVVTRNVIREQVENPCNFSDFNTQLFCLINDYRADQGASALSLSTNLTAVAGEQAVWMASEQDLSPKDGDDVTERCQNLNIECQEELIAHDTIGTAENFLDQWIQQSNDKLLGSFTQIGVGNEGEYAAVVFN